MVLEECKELLNELKKLDEIVSQVDDLKRKLDKEVDREIIRHSVFLSVIFSVVVMFIYAKYFASFSGDKGDFSNISALSLFLEMFLVGFISWGLGLFVREVLKRLWLADWLPGGRKSSMRHLLPRYVKNKKKNSAQIRELLKNEKIKNTELPQKYLNIVTLKYLIKAVETGEAASVRDAVLLLELEAQDRKARELLIPKENLIHRAKRLQHLNLVSAGVAKNSRNNENHQMMFENRE